MPMRRRDKAWVDVAPMDVSSVLIRRFCDLRVAPSYRRRPVSTVPAHERFVGGPQPPLR